MYYDENYYLKQVGAEIAKVNAGHPDEDSYRAGYFETRFRHVAEKADNERTKRLEMARSPELMVEAFFKGYPSKEDVLDLLSVLNRYLKEPVNLIEHPDHREKIQMVDLSDVIGQLEDVIYECKRLEEFEKAQENADRIQDERRDEAMISEYEGRN